MLCIFQSFGASLWGTDFVVRDGLAEVLSLGCEPVAPLQHPRHDSCRWGWQHTLAVLEKVVMVLGADGDTLKVHFGGCSRIRIKYDIQYTLKRRWDCHKLNDHPAKPIWCDMAGGVGSILIFFCHEHLPKARVSVNAWVHFSVSLGVSTFIHSRQEIYIPDGNRTKLVLVSTYRKVTLVFQRVLS